VGETFAFHVSEHSLLWTSRNPISPIGLRSSITVYTSQPKSRKIKTIENRFIKSHFEDQTSACYSAKNRSTDFQISVDRYSRFYQEYQSVTYRSTDLPKSVDRFVLWTNQFKIKPKPKLRVQTIIKIIFDEAKYRQ